MYIHTYTIYVDIGLDKSDFAAGACIDVTGFED